MLKHSLFKISYVSAGNLFNAALGFAFIAIIAKTLPLEHFGKYALLTSFLVFISKIMDFGTNSTYVSQSITKNDNITNKFLSSKILLFLISLPISVVFLYGFNLLNLQTFIVFTIGLILYGINFTLFSYFQKKELFLKAILLNTLPAIAKGIFAALIFFKLISVDLSGAFAIFSFSMILSMIFISFAPNHIIKSFKFAIDWSFIKESIPAGISILIGDGWSAINNSVAKYTGSFVNVGIFSLADKISNIFSLVSLSIFTVLLPKNANRKKVSLKYDFKETMVISALILILSLIAIFAAQIFINQFFNGKFEDSIKILDILIFSSAFTAIYSFMRDYFFIEEQTHYLLWISILKLALFLIASAFLVSSMGIVGIATANLIASVAALIATVLFVKDNGKN